MAVIPSKYSSPSGSDKEKIAALERYIKYVQEQIEQYASSAGKRIAELEKKINGGK